LNWLAFITADVLKEFTPAEQATLQNIQGATNALADICTESIAEFRQAISDAGTDLSSATAGTIPEGFKAKAAALARWRWLISLPQAKLMQTEERKAAALAAETLINDIATGKRPVTAPGASTGGIARPSFGTRGGSAANDPRAREFTRETQEGS
jgi:hypothetical protein